MIKPKILYHDCYKTQKDSLVKLKLPRSNCEFMKVIKMQKSLAGNF